ncbi:MAG: class II glutamine amidotransferase [Pyrobaculum sp.]
MSNALKQAAKYDPYKPAGDRQHGDGWGFVAASPHGYLFYKSNRPAWEDPTPVPMREAALAHARAASPGEPKGPQHAHPYAVETPDGRVLFVAHNGSVDKAALSHDVGLDSSAYTDSYILAKFLAKRWHDPQKAFEKALPYVKTALNVAVLEFPMLDAYVYTYYRENRQYYALYLVKSGSAVAVVSSTLTRYVHGEELGNGVFLKL